MAWLCAEALVAYRARHCTAADSEVEWRNARGWDVRVVRPSGAALRINAKRCWRRHVREGFLAYGGPIDPDPAKVDIFALVVIEDDEVDARWSQTPDGGVGLHAEVGPATIYFVPVSTITEHARWDGKSNRSPLLAEASVAPFTELPADDTPGREQ